MTSPTLCDDVVLPLDRTTYSVETRLALLEQQANNMCGHVEDIKASVERMQDDLGQLVHITAIGKTAWRGLIWLGTLVTGTVTLIYFLSQIRNLWPLSNLLHGSFPPAPP
jgi:hypothetical protein